MFGWIEAALLLLCLAPVALGIIGVWHRVKAHHAADEALLKQRMIRQLDRVERHADDRQFFHDLLTRLCERADQQADPRAWWARTIPRIKAAYPDVFTFIFWDDKGTLWSDLTDQSGHRYILRKTWEILSLIHQELKGTNPRFPSQIPTIRTRFGLVKRYLGNLLSPDHLSLLTSLAERPGPLLAKHGNHRSHLWFRISKRFGMLCFMNRHAFQHQIGLRKVMHRFNNHRRSDGMRLGFAHVPFLAQPDLPGIRQLPVNVAWAIQQAELAIDPLIRADGFLILIRHLGARLRVFALAPDPWRQGSLTILAALLRPFLLAGVGILVGLLWLWLRRGKKRWFFSIRWELSGFFLYTAGLPLMIVLFYSLDYLSSMRAAAEEAWTEQTFQAFDHFERRFDRFVLTLSEALNRFVADPKRFPAGRLPPDTPLAGILPELETFNPSEVTLISMDRAETRHIRPTVGRMVARPQQSIFAELGADTLRFLAEGGMTKACFSKMRKEHPDSRRWQFVQGTLDALHEIRPIRLGDTFAYVYLGPLGPRSGFVPQHILVVAWEPERFEELFLQQSLTASLAHRQGWVLAARVGSSGEVHPTSLRGYPSLRRLFERTLAKTQAQEQHLDLGRQSYLGVGRMGRHLTHTALVGLVPRRLIDARMEARIREIGFMALLSLIFAGGIGLVLARRVMEPIGILQEGVAAIGARTFTHRLPYLGNDELGLVGATFNETLVGLEELDLGRVVQESFLPTPRSRVGAWRLAGRSCSMTQMGGDYFDFLPGPDPYLRLIIGDVTGHGVGAALIMAMAKAGVALHEFNADDPGKLILDLNHVVRTCQGARSRRFMTFQQVVVNTETGSGLVVSAGHCFPILVRPSMQHACLLEVPGMPLGISRPQPPVICRFDAHPGDALLLYTDGLIEAQSASGEAFGYKRLASTALTAFDADPERWIHAILQVISAHSQVPGDDLTVVGAIFAPLSTDPSMRAEDPHKAS